jgi:hypothetical protein
MKSTAFYVVMACTSETDRRFERTCLLYLQGRRVKEARNCRNQSTSRSLQPWRWGWYVPPKRRSVSDLHCVPFGHLGLCRSSEVPTVTPHVVNMQTFKWFLFARSPGSKWDDWRLKRRHSKCRSCSYEYCSYIGAAGTQFFPLLPL